MSWNQQESRREQRLRLSTATPMRRFASYNEQVYTSSASKRLENVHQGGRQRWSTPINLTLIVTLNLVVCSVCCGEAKTGTEKNELDSAKRGVLRYDETITGVSFPGLPCQNTLASSDWSGNRTFDDNTCEQQKIIGETDSTA